MILILAAVLGCQSEPPVPVPAEKPPQSQPIAITLGEKPNPVPEPVGDAIFDEFPAVGALPEGARQNAVFALDLTPATCPPCAGRSLGRCALAPPPGCENALRLVLRVVRMAKKGDEYTAIVQAVSYPDSWFSVAPEGNPAFGNPEAPVLVVAWVAPDAAFASRAMEDAAALHASFGDRVRIDVRDPALAPVEAERLGVRATPTWFIDGYRFRGAQSVDVLADAVRRALEDRDRDP